MVARVITAYVSIGNSDDKLTQKEWAKFFAKTRILMNSNNFTVHGEWHSLPQAQWQNACWCVEYDEDLRLVNKEGDVVTLGDHFIRRLMELAAEFRQDSIAWAKADTAFIAPKTPS